jgi:hypothetical protein
VFRGSLVVMNVPWPFIYLASPVPPILQAPPPALMAQYPMGLPPLLQPPLPPNEHLEIWAVLASSPQPRRLVADVGAKNSDEELLNFPGFDVVLGVDPNDPCMIRGLDPDDAYCESNAAADPIKCGSISVTKPSLDLPEGSSPQEIDAIHLTAQRRVRQVAWRGMPFYALPLTPAPTFGLANQPLLALVKRNRDYLSDPRTGGLLRVTPWNAADPAASAQRLATCRSYRSGLTDSNRDGKRDEKDETRQQTFYVGNPYQYTKPLSGTLYGFFAFQTNNNDQSGKPPTDMAPTQIYSGISFTVPWAADDIVSLLITRETTEFPTQPSMNRVVIAAKRTPDSVAGRGTIRMQAIGNPQLACPQPPCVPYPSSIAGPTTFVGTVTVITNLDTRLE